MGWQSQHGPESGAQRCSPTHLEGLHVLCRGQRLGHRALSPTLRQPATHTHRHRCTHTHTHTHGGTEDRRASSTRPTHRTWPPSSQCWPPPLATVRPMPPRPPPCPWARRPQSPPRPQAPRQPPPPRRARPAQSCAAAARPGSYRSRHRGVSMHLTATPEVCAQWRTYARAVSRSFTSRAITRHAASCWYSACDSSCRAYVFPDTHKQTK
jgi:hypothetical protein